MARSPVTEPGRGAADVGEGVELAAGVGVAGPHEAMAKTMTKVITTIRRGAVRQVGGGHRISRSSSK